MPEMDDYARKLYVSNPLRKPLLRQVIAALGLASGSKGLDAGCGIGLQTLVLAEAVGPAGHVIGIDIAPGFLALAEKFAETAGMSKRVTFRQGDVSRLPFDDDAFDWAWSADCVGYAPHDPLPALKELKRTVRPGGRMAILVYSSQQLLPGYPLLEARLNATAAGIAPFKEGMRPERHSMRMLGRLRELGIKTPMVQTFVGSVSAPLQNDIRDALIALFDMRWAGAKSEVSGKEWAKFQRLCRPGSEELILDIPDYYAFFTYSLFQGQVIKE